MQIFQYGTTAIDWEFKVDPKLSNHYVTVERGKKYYYEDPTFRWKSNENLFAIVQDG